MQVKHVVLPHDGIIPGARGHKKITIPRGTKVYCIVYGTLIFWAAYLDEPSALKVAENLEATIRPEARRHIPLQTLLAWNFKSTIPKRISRPKTKG
jgi:hypothetical protein